MVPGLPLCVLSKNSSGQKRARPTPLPPPPVDEPVFDVSGSSASLLSTVLNGDTDTALLLIEDGADVNAEDQHGDTFLNFGGMEQPT